MTRDFRTRPLEGLRVLDMTSALAGPFCTLLLGSLGAEVIKIERPGGGDLARSNPPYVGPNGIHLHAESPDDHSVSLLNRSRNKRSLTLDASTPQGRDVLHDLVRRSDVFVQSLSSGTVQKLGADYETLHKINPRLVYCSIDGVSPDSTFASTKIMDIIIQALSGVMDVTGEPGTPPMRVGVPIGDLVAPMFAVSGILAALRVVDREGVGQNVTVGLVESLALLVALEHFDASAAVGLPKRSGNSHSRLAPFGVYECKDGHMAIAALLDPWFRALTKAMDHPELVRDERFSSRGRRVKFSSELDQIIQGWTLLRSKAEVWEVLSEQHGVPCAPVRTVEEVLDDASLHARNILVDLPHPDPEVSTALVGSGVPWQFSRSEVSLKQPAPRLGQDTAALLHDVLGLGEDEVAALRTAGVI
ncbi:CaiB/BaiF CoA transferase family protein [Amycolatopsis pithecellobii]|uniref:CaiB/BaiF CoA transferase family protein n=1 Tax=Amycolatopsis pithecellobii TaxID=664692 RepID=UPI0014081B1B|nr:CoA transferase [Amycolatopsis pithecellobii]